MANQEHLDLLKQGSAAWNTWRDQHSVSHPDLSEAYLIGIDLGSANLSGVNLSGASLGGAHLSFANLSEADLSFANLINTKLSRAYLSNAYLFYANLSEADLSNTNLSNADLSGANLSNTNLSGADLSGADLSQARTLSTIFGNIDLSKVKGLTTVQHRGPSTIGLDTIYRSQGKIPERFLREAGVPDSFLDYMHSLVGQPIQYFTCFISHSHHDQRFCDRLHADLRSHDVPSWYFPEDAIGGKPVWGEIDRSIKLYDKLVVVCSKDSLQSGPVLREIERALQREDHEGKHILFPLRIDDYLFKKWEHHRKADVVDKVVVDFRGWRNVDKYDQSFQKFLKALKAQEETTKK